MVRVAEHLSIAELEERFRTAKDPILARHVQVIWLLAQGHTSAEVSTVTSFVPRWIEPLRARYNAEGFAALGDLRRHNGRAPSLLKPDLLERLRVRLADPPPDGGLVDEWESGVLDGRRARACLGLCPTWLGGSARDRVVDPEAAPASSEGGHARGGIHV